MGGRVRAAVLVMTTCDYPAEVIEDGPLCRRCGECRTLGRACYHCLEEHREEGDDMNDEFNKLTDYLAKLPIGPVEDKSALAALLSPVWGEFDGASESSMHAWKLDRMENPNWDPPVLTFRIERHGGTALGSTRAEMQGWTINVTRRTADHGPSGVRQLHPMDKKWNPDSLVEELISAIVEERDDPRVKRLPDGRIRLTLSKLIPEGGFNQTRDGRQKRLRHALEEALAAHGWVRAGANAGTYRKER